MSRKAVGIDIPVVVLTTSKTTTSGVLAVLANTTVTGGDVAAVLASLGEPCRHFLYKMKGNSKRDQRSVRGRARKCHPKVDQSIQHHRIHLLA